MKNIFKAKNFIITELVLLGIYYVWNLLLNNETIARWVVFHTLGRPSFDCESSVGFVCDPGSYTNSTIQIIGNWVLIGILGFYLLLFVIYQIVKYFKKDQQGQLSK